MPGSIRHLTGRFFDVLLARRLDTSDLEFLATKLTPREMELFSAQPVADQRHGLDCALNVIASGTEDIEALKAAALHDVGKRHSDLGIVTRSLASILIKTGMPLTKTMVIYRDHGAHGARDLEAWGASPLVVRFAETHHGARPDEIDPETWETLVAADRPTMHRRRRSVGISS